MLEAARGGDRQALEALLVAHYDRVHALCRRMLGSDTDALDATQDALLSAVRALDRFDGRSSFATWLYRITTNTCIDELRRRRRRPVPGYTQDIAEPDDSSVSSLWRTSGSGAGLGAGGGPGAGGGADASGDATAAVATRLDVERALATLPVELRTAVVLRDVCDLPYDEIAAIMDVPIGTIRSRIARGRAAVAGLLDAEAGGRASAGGDAGAGAGVSAGARAGNPDRSADVQTQVGDKTPPASLGPDKGETPS